MNDPQKLGLSLSGGGYRAAAFHLGTLKKLKTLGILDKVDVISAISGGSIAGAYFLMHQANFEEFETGFKSCLKKSVMRRIIFSRYLMVTYLFLFGLPALVVYLAGRHHTLLSLFPWMCGATCLSVLILLLVVFQFRLLPFSRLKRKAYNKIFFNKALIGALPRKPVLAINATNLETGMLWTFSQQKVSDSAYEYYKNTDGSAHPIRFSGDKIPVATAVASSTNVPFIFNPVKIDKVFFNDAGDYKLIKPKLVDGGIYDNQGIHKLTQEKSSYRCDIVIASDGSQPFAKQFNGNNSMSVMYRANDIMMRKIKNMQFIRDVYAKSVSEIAYYSLDWYYLNCVVSFTDLLISGKLDPKLMNAHGLLQPSDVEEAHKKQQKQELITAVKNKIAYDEIIMGSLTDQQISAISLIPTGLSALSETQIDHLARHAATLTEIQVKLYCPSLFLFSHAL